LVKQPLDFNKPSILKLKDFFSLNKKLGSADRFFLKELYYTYIRNRILINTIKVEFESIEDLALTVRFLNPIPNLTGRKLKLYKYLQDLSDSSIGANERFIKSKLAELNYNSIDSLSIRYSLPKIILNDISKLASETQLIELSSNLHTISPKTVRKLHSSADTLGNDTFTKSALFTDSYLSYENFDLNEHPVLNPRDYFIQDDGSRYIANICNPKPGLKILDACAGAGGKSIALSYLCPDCQIIAFDKNPKKLANLQQRIKMHGINNIFTIRSADLEKMRDSFDIVLVDAPCTGSGTIRRFPEKKYTITEDLIKSFPNKQFDILTKYSNFVKNEGKLVYSTCSFLFSENQNVINRFINGSDFKPFDINSDLNTSDLKKKIEAKKASPLYSNGSKLI
jgi:16S rRNA (cytosine967-C5)-methyltransferase